MSKENDMVIGFSLWASGLAGLQPWLHASLRFLLGAIAIAVLGLACVGPAQGQTITFRGENSSASASTPIALRAAGAAASRNGGNVTPGLPAGFVQGDIHIAVVEQRDNVVSSISAGWTLLNAANSGTTHRASLYWRRAQTGDAAPTITHPGGGSIIAQIIGFSGVDRTNAFDVANSFTVSAADLTTEAGAITTATPNTMLVFTAHMADNHTGIGVPAGSTTWTLGFFSATNAGVDSSVGAYYGLRAGAGAQAAVTATRTGANNAISHGAQIALKPALTIAKPVGTVQDDVMIASISARPSTVTIAAPSGWTLVRRVDNGTGSTNSLATYYKVAGASEPAEYTWSISASTGAAGGIQSFANVDTVTPIDVENGQVNAIALAQATPSVTTTVADTVVVTSYAFPSSSTWTPPGGMTEAFDDASLTVPNAVGLSIEGDYVAQATIGATGTKTATASGDADTGATHILALRPRAHHFAISVTNSPDTDTCTAATLTITAQDKNNNTVINYTGTINLSTSAGHGDWGLGSSPVPSGILNNGTADDGMATYAFAASDTGVVKLTLTDVHDDDLGVTAVDSTRSSTSATSGTIQFRGNFFQIANDPLQIAGRSQAMTATLKQGASCLNTLTVYPDGNHAFKAWFTPDVDNPSGALAPAITGASPAITASVPASDNLTLSFTSGVAPFTLATADVGKYLINLRDDSRTFAANVVNGTSPTITTRPFVLIVSGISQGTTSNPSGTATSGGKFIASADTFQATLGAYLWSSAADTTPADGSPDATATFAQITATGAAPAYRWPTTLAAASSYTPATGTLGVLGNGILSGACPAGSPNCFSNGIATPNELSYPEAGSFTLTGAAANFLNSGIDLTALVFDNSATPARNAVVGRFFPDHFTLLAGPIVGSTITPACAGGAFTYMGQPNLGYSFTIEARNKSDSKVNNYNTATYTTGTVSMLAEDSDNGTDLSARLPATTGSWLSGTYSFNPADIAFTRPISVPDGPFDSLQIGIKVLDSDGPVLASRDMDPATSAACTSATCAGIFIGSGATTKVRFGRLRLNNAHGSELLRLPIPMEAQYWNGTTFVTNSADSCTSITAGNITMDYIPTTPTLAACETAISGGGALVAGKGTLYLSRPGASNSGSVTLRMNLGTAAGNTCLASPGAEIPVTTADRPYLRSKSGAAYNSDPAARATFGIYKSGPVIYMREMY